MRWRELLPGAIVAGVGQAAVLALGWLVLRPVVVSQAQRFGAIGVAFAVVTTLTVLGVLPVIGAGSPQNRGEPLREPLGSSAATPTSAPAAASA